MGRRAIDITPEICEKAAELASQGLSRRQIAINLGMGNSTLYEKQAKYPEFLDSIQRGAETANADVINALYQTAVSGNVRACEVWLYNKCKDEWKREPSEETTRDIPPINITLVTDDPNKATN